MLDLLTIILAETVIIVGSVAYITLRSTCCVYKNI